MEAHTLRVLEYEKIRALLLSHATCELGKERVRLMAPLTDAREIEQPARADPVHAALILLDLLEGQAEGFAKLFLAHAKKRATQPHASADMDIDRARAMFAFHPFYGLIVRHQHLRCCATHDIPPAAIAVNAATPRRSSRPPFIFRQLFFLFSIIAVLRISETFSGSFFIVVDSFRSCFLYEIIKSAALSFISPIKSLRHFTPSFIFPV